MAAVDEALVDALRDYVGAPAPTDYMRGCVEVAQHLIAAETGNAQGIPGPVLQRAVLEVAAELFHRRNAPNGIKAFGDLDSAATLRVARDAMVAARPLLAPWLNPLVFS